MMRHNTLLFALVAAGSLSLAGCGGGGSVDVGVGGGGGGGGGGATPTSYIGTAGTFVAFADPTQQAFDSAPLGSYAGKRQVLRGSVDFTTGQSLGQPAGLEIYKGSDGHIYEVDLTSVDEPQPQQVSSESGATVDDTCSLSGTQVAGATTGYVGEYFAADLENPTNSSYFYRLPGAGGVCNSGSDTIRMVKTGMSDTDAPVTVPAMPVATVHDDLGGITGFVVPSGNQLLLVDANFANPVVLGSFSSTIGVAQELPTGELDGVIAGQLFLVDGNVVYVDYVAHTTSTALFTVPNWTSTRVGAEFAASPTMLYVAVNTPSGSGAPASTAIYGIPANGSALAAGVDNEAGAIQTLAFPVNGADLLWGVSSGGGYAVRAMPDGGGTATTLVTSPVNDGTFVATADAVYYTTWSGSSNGTTHVVTRSGTSAGVVGMDGSTIQAPVASSMFVDGGERAPWTADPTAHLTPFVTMFMVQNLSTVTVTNPTTGVTYTEDAVAGGTVTAIDATTNQIVATVGHLAAGTAVTLTGTFSDPDHNGFLEAVNPVSTGDPSTRTLYVLNSHQDDSLTPVTGNL